MPKLMRQQRHHLVFRFHKLQPGQGQVDIARTGAIGIELRGRRDIHSTGPLRHARSLLDLCEQGIQVGLHFGQLNQPVALGALVTHILADIRPLTCGRHRRQLTDLDAAAQAGQL